MYHETTGANISDIKNPEGVKVSDSGGVFGSPEPGFGYKIYYDDSSFRYYVSDRKLL
jgi:hypothetical protein